MPPLWVTVVMVPSRSRCSASIRLLAVSLVICRASGQRTPASMSSMARVTRWNGVIVRAG